MLAEVAHLLPQASILLVRHEVASASSLLVRATLTFQRDVLTMPNPVVRLVWRRFARCVILCNAPGAPVPVVLGHRLSELGLPRAGSAQLGGAWVIFEHFGAYIRSVDCVKLCSTLTVWGQHEVLLTEYGCLSDDSVSRILRLRAVTTSQSRPPSADLLELAQQCCHEGRFERRGGPCGSQERCGVPSSQQRIRLIISTTQAEQDDEKVKKGERALREPGAGSIELEHDPYHFRMNHRQRAPRSP